MRLAHLKTLLHHHGGTSSPPPPSTLFRLPSKTFRLFSTIVSPPSKAVVYDEQGSPDAVCKVRELPPVPMKEDDVCVRMLAAPINPSDINRIEGPIFSSISLLHFSCDHVDYLSLLVLVYCVLIIDCLSCHLRWFLCLIEEYTKPCNCFSTQFSLLYVEVPFSFLLSLISIICLYCEKEAFIRKFKELV